MKTRESKRFLPYKSALLALSARTGTALPSLMVSFAVLHEVTAFVPLAGIFFGARALGIGENVVQLVQRHPAGLEQSWFTQTCQRWIQEGEARAERIGSRYGIWGYTKGQMLERGQARENSKHIAGDVANAVVAYASVKAMLPLRVGLSLYLSPAFSRRIVDPFSASVMRIFRRCPPK